jgi:hypothetical protein
MALFENGILGNGLTTGLLVGVGAAIVAPAVFPALATVAKPLVKGAIKVGVSLYEKGNEAIAEVGEVLEDLVAEAKSEMVEEQKAAAAVGTVTKHDG